MSTKFLDKYKKNWDVKAKQIKVSYGYTDRPTAAEDQVSKGSPNIQVACS